MSRFFFKDVLYPNDAKWSSKAELHLKLQRWGGLIKDYITECCQDYRGDVDNWVTHKTRTTFLKDLKTNLSSSLFYELK